MSKLLGRVLLIAVCASPLLATTAARADGCYICASGSSEVCKNYCRYGSEDTFKARKECEKRGCKIGGTASCPTAVNYKVCLAPAKATDTTVAAIPWCSPETRS